MLSTMLSTLSFLLLKDGQAQVQSLTYEVAPN
jgi:hypothetical protein